MTGDSPLTAAGAEPLFVFDPSVVGTTTLTFRQETPLRGLLKWSRDDLRACVFDCESRLSMWC